MIKPHHCSFMLIQVASYIVVGMHFYFSSGSPYDATSICLVGQSHIELLVNHNENRSIVARKHTKLIANIYRIR